MTRRFGLVVARWPKGPFAVLRISSGFKKLAVNVRIKWGRRNETRKFLEGPGGSSWLPSRRRNTGARLGTIFVGTGRRTSVSRRNFVHSGWRTSFQVGITFDRAAPKKRAAPAGEF